MMNYQKLFDHMFQEHGLTLTEGQMQDIIHEVKTITATETDWKPETLQSKGKTKEEVTRDELLSGLKQAHESLQNKQYKHGRMQVGILMRMLEQESHANKDGWVKEHVKCATLCAGCKEDCQGREAYFITP